MNAKDEFGWRSIFKVYTSKDILGTVHDFV